jgi:hypothetical protein
MQENKIFRVLERTVDINAEEIRIIEHKYAKFRNMIQSFFTVLLEVSTSAVYFFSIYFFANLLDLSRVHDIAAKNILC